MISEHSSYYPKRRSLWRSRVLDWIGVRARRYLSRLSSGFFGVPLIPLVAVLIIPGLALRWTPFARFSRVWWGVYLGCGLVAFVAMGFLVAGIALGLMAGLHTAAVLALCRPSGASRSIFLSLFLSLMTLCLVYSVVYQPLISLLQRNLFMPLITPAGVVVVNRMSRASGVRPGDTVAYALHQRPLWGHWARIQLSEGMGLEKVSAGAGDHVEFGIEGMVINGVAFPRTANMPLTGSVKVPEGCWFIWPNLRRYGGYNMDADVSEALMSVAIVRYEDFLGRPFHRWLGRLQTLP